MENLLHTLMDFLPPLLVAVVVIGALAVADRLLIGKAGNNAATASRVQRLESRILIAETLFEGERQKEKKEVE